MDALLSVKLNNNPVLVAALEVDCQIPITLNSLGLNLQDWNCISPTDVHSFLARLCLDEK